MKRKLDGLSTAFSLSLFIKQWRIMSVVAFSRLHFRLAMPSVHIFSELYFIRSIFNWWIVSSHDRSSQKQLHAKYTLVHNISRSALKILLNCSVCFSRFDAFVCFLPLMCHCWRCRCCKTSSHVNAVLSWDADAATAFLSNLSYLNLRSVCVRLCASVVMCESVALMMKQC